MGAGWKDQETLLLPPSPTKNPPEARLPGLFLLSPKAICGGGGGGEVKEETAFGSGLWLFVAL